MWVVDNGGTRVHLTNTQHRAGQPEPYKSSFASPQQRQVSNERIDQFKQKLETGQKGIDSHVPESPEWKAAANDYFGSINALREEQKALLNEQQQIETLKRNGAEPEIHSALNEQLQWLQTQEQKVGALLQQTDGNPSSQVKAGGDPFAKVAYQRDPSNPAQPTAQKSPAATININDVKSSQEAVLAIHALPIPDSSDLAGSHYYVADKIYEGRAEVFNKARHDAAQAALDKFRPDRNGYAGPNGSTASHEYLEDMSWYNNDPYIAELKRIVAETTTNPKEIPAYLRTSNQVQPDVSKLSTEQMRTTLARIGVDLPANANATQLQAGYDLLATMPPEIFSKIVNPGMAFGYSQSMVGAGTTNWSPARGNADVQVQGKVELSNVYTGVDFRQTQQFEMSVQIQGNVQAQLGDTPLNTMYQWADRLKQVPDSVSQLIESSSVLRNVVKGLPVSGSYTEFAGARLKYEANVTPQQGQQLDKGHLSAAPNPFDPVSMPQGTSVLIRGQSLTGSEFEASYKAFNISGKETDLNGLGFGVTRLEGSMVQVYSGPVKTVEAESFLGVSNGSGSARAGVEVSTSYEQQQMSTAVIDLSTSEGKAAYQKFISTGQVPNWSPPGVQKAGTADVFTGDHAARLAVEAGPISIGMGNKSLLNVTRTTWQDGTIEQQVSYALTPNHLTNVQFIMGTDGKIIEDKTKWQIVLGNHDPVLASYMNGAYGPDAFANAKYDGDQHVQLTFSSADLMKLRELARESVQKIEGGAERLARMEQGHETLWGVRDLLAVAKTPDDVFQVLSGNYSTNHLAQSFLTIRIQSGEAIPGQMQMKDAG